MNKSLTLSAPTALLSGLLLATGCSSSGDGSASVPANAITINSTNAEATVESAVSDYGEVSNVFGIETKPAIKIKNTLDIIKAHIKDSSSNSGIDLANGVAISESGDCGGVGDGTFSFSGNENTSGTTESGEINASFNNCRTAGILINGQVSVSFTDNLSTGDYTADFHGNLSVLVSGENTTFSLQNVQFSENGNDFTNTYSITKLTYAVDFIMNGAGGGGFLVTLTAPIVESDGDTCPDSGHITITGANGTTAEGIYNGDGTFMTIKANGETVRTDAPCFSQV